MNAMHAAAVWFVSCAAVGVALAFNGHPWIALGALGVACLREFSGKAGGV